MWIDINKMTLEEIIEYCDDIDHRHTKWLMNLFIRNEGFENALMILAENGRILQKSVSKRIPPTS